MNNYTKPTLVGVSAISSIQDVHGNPKQKDGAEPNFLPTDPAYQADE
jgi:hypothetical protein